MGARADNFNRADQTGLGTPSDSGAGYVAGSTLFDINGNKAQPHSPFGAAYLETTTLADVDAQITLSTVVNGVYQGLSISGNNGVPDFYGFEYVGDGGDSRFVRYDTFGVTNINTGLGGFSNGTVIRMVRVGNVITCYKNGVQVAQTTDSWANGNTRHGFRGGDSGCRLDDFSLSVPVPVNPTAFITKGTTSSLDFSVSDGTPGPAPITRLGLYRYTSSDFTPPGTGTLISSASGGTLTDSAVPAGVSFYKHVVKDVNNVNYSTPVMPGIRWRRPAYLGFIGDSITRGYQFPSGTLATTPPMACIDLLRELGGNRDTDHLNQGQDASETSDWIPGSSGGNYLPGAITAFNGWAKALSAIIITLGVNDSISPRDPDSVFKANIVSIANYLIAHITNWLDVPMIILNVPPGAATGDHEMDSMIQYSLRLRQVVDGSRIFLGDEDAITTMPQHAGDWMLDNNVHPNQLGAIKLGQLWARGYAKALRELEPAITRASSHVGL